MPRGFLVKRNKHSGPHSYRARHSSDEDRSESGSDQEYVHTNFGSPDSGYSASPISGSFRERFGGDADFISVRSPVGHSPVGHSSVGHSPSSSPLTVSTMNYPSPLYYATFDRLTVRGNTVVDFTTPTKQDRPSPVGSITPISPSKKRINTDQNSENKIKTPKKSKAARKINFDEDTSSPVSGTIIRALGDFETDGRVICGDIDSKFNCVEVTPEAKAELDKIENKIGEYICQLCKEFYVDAFQLAQHRCCRIVHVEYRCPECDKVFNCPANLASHRRWHKPRPTANGNPSVPAKILPANTAQDRNGSDITSTGTTTTTPGDFLLSPRQEGQFSCEKCNKKFRRQAYLRKHIQTHVTDAIFVCQYCSKVYQNDNARAKHEISHVNGKELTCTLCNASFPNKIVLEKHVRHHGDDTYPCKYCSSTFCSSPGLTRHINKCHPTENRQVILLQLPVTRPC